MHTMSCRPARVHLNIIELTDWSCVWKPTPITADVTVVIITSLALTCLPLTEHDIFRE